MTQVTPPGWYPDPGQTSDGPATERWWDGSAWTDRTRPAGSADVGGPPAPSPTAGTPPAYQAHPAYPTYPAYPGQPPAGGRRGLRTGIAVAVAAAVLASIGVGVYALADSGTSDGGTANSQQRPDGRGGPFGDSGGSGGPSPEPRESAPGSQPPRVESGSVTDSVSGISLPVPDGWYGQAISVGASVTSKESYKCPGDTAETCTKGGAYSAPAIALGANGDTPEEVAKADIAKNAEDSYGEGYGGITSHEVLASRAVTVAGQKGYLVRWKAVTKTGADGYVESLAFPSPANSGQMVLVRFGVDVGEKQSVIDEITKGIKVAAGSGNGQDV
ncbi:MULTISPECIES: DUF2510 domain-containing protein [unclassified Streptomyces]|uniref:DUF2510 domain-containing protein n=1 Tax=unclassified Streptomyces TaxID=2593676 RepID=UPI001661C32B|nr:MULTISPECIES: DUF2510 domain-containing protein [unclassified Streptomyces]MBD0841308.1 DUF2510 domain-containing protein [Streptomyces sp. TRM68416]